MSGTPTPECRVASGGTDECDAGACWVIGSLLPTRASGLSAACCFSFSFSADDPKPKLRRSSENPRLAFE